MSAGGFPSETTYTHRYEVQIERRNGAGRSLVPVTRLKTNDLAEAEAAHAEAVATYAGTSLAKRNVPKLVERAKWADQ
jgi:hypothetical protein